MLNLLINSNLHTISGLPLVEKFVNCHRFLQINMNVKKSNNSEVPATNFIIFVCLHNKLWGIHKI